MSNVDSNAGKKGYCFLYLILFLFLVIGVILMVYWRNFNLTFPTLN